MIAQHEANSLMEIHFSTQKEGSLMDRLLKAKTEALRECDTKIKTNPELKNYYSLVKLMIM